MIAKDQPTIFGDSLIAALSSRGDGNLKFGLEDNDTVLKNRLTFLKNVAIDPAYTTLVAITYDTDDFTKYRIADLTEKSVGMADSSHVKYADALVAQQPGHALFLPLADCVGAILFDPKKRILMVSHLGRHSAEQEGGRKSVAYLQDTFGANPADLLVWLSPAVGKATYPLQALSGKGLQEVIAEQLQAAGVVKAHIEASPIDTARDENYYSHSEFLKGNRQENGRFAIVAMMPAQGKPAA
jgi:polyphenol oxidase